MPHNPWPHGLTKEKRAEIITALKANPNASQVARDISDVSYLTVLKISKEEKIELSFGGRPVKETRPAATPTPDPISPEQREQIIAALRTNPRPTVAKIAEEAGVRRVTVWKIANGEKIDLSKQAPPATNGHIRSNRVGRPASIPQEKREQVLAALKANPNAAAVAKKIGGVSSTTVGDIAKIAGIELTAGKKMQQQLFGPKLSTDTRKKIVALLGANESVQSIREKTGVSGTTIRIIAKTERERTTTKGTELTAPTADCWALRPAGTGLTVTVGGEEKKYIELEAVPALAKKSIADTFKEAANLFGGVSRNMPNGEFRSELFKLVQKFDRKPGGVG